MTAGLRKLPLMAGLVAMCVLGLPSSAGARSYRAADRVLTAVSAKGSSSTTLETPPERWVTVSVATLWVRPGIGRPVDAPALSNPAKPAQWVAGMSVEQKRWLVGRLETQALYGQRVYLLDTSGDWSKIAVPNQPTPRNGLGYPGWVPTVQLTDSPPAMAPGDGERTAIVKQRTAWLWETAELTGRVLRLSYGTRLAAVAWSPTSVEVVSLGGTHRFLRRSAVALHTPGEPWPVVTGARLVREVKRFVGLEYLWAGTTGFGFDCSGLTYAVHQALGKTIPRDAGPQAARGERISTRADLRPGDLVFFRDASGRIHHVGMYVGGGQMIHSPHTGAAVRMASISVEPYVSEFAGGRRYWRQP